jgi:hypothetical protein
VPLSDRSHCTRRLFASSWGEESMFEGSGWRLLPNLPPLASDMSLLLLVVGVIGPCVQTRVR